VLLLALLSGAQAPAPSAGAQPGVSAASGDRASAARDDDDDDDRGAPIGRRSYSFFAGRSGLLGTGVIALAFYFLFVRGGRGGGSAGWGSYYLFWIVAPILIALVSSHPAVLIVVVVGFLARRWLPDPYLAFKYRGRIRSLEADVGANPGNITARRDLAAIWLEKRRPQRALPLLEQALAGDPDSRELEYMLAVANLYAKNHERAVELLIKVIHGEPGFRYGEPYLRAADALTALGRLDDAEDALDHFVRTNKSSLEGHYKRARVCKARKDEAGARAARRDLGDLWRTLPSFQRRRQLGWYLRALVLR
jgi:tetratricopeptide (TPR) repeat protein